MLVTHDQAEALSLADQVAVMRDGRPGAGRLAPTVYERRPTPSVAAFVGGAVLLRARLEDGVATCVLGELPVAGRPYEAATEVDVLIRPEQLELKSALEDDGVPAQVLSVSYFGHDADVRLQLAGAEGDRRSHARFIHRQAGRPGARCGQRIRAGVPGLDE